MSEEKLKQKRDDVKWMLSTEQGRRFAWDLLSYCGVYRSLEGDPNAMLIQEGSRRIGLYLLGILSDASEDLVFKMMLEAKNRTLEEIRKNEHTNDDGTKDDYDRTIEGSYASDLPDADAYSGPGSFL